MKKTLLLLAGGLLLTTSVQAQWVQQPFSFAQDLLPLYTDAVDANTAWALSSGLFTQDAANQVARTFNGGQNWTVLTISGVNTATETVQSLSAVSATTAWVVTLNDTGGRILKTSDGGSTWVRQGANAFSTDSYPNTIYFFNANDGMVMGDPDGANGGGPEIYYTANGGTTWTRVLNVPVGTSGEYGTFFPPAAVGNSIWFPNDEGDIFHSTDKGVTWTVARGVASEPIENIAFRDEQNGLAVIADANATNHELYRTADGGTTWRRTTYTGPLRGWGLDNVPGTGNYLSVGINLGNGDSGSSYSRDNGQTWTNIETTINHLFVDAASPTAVWSGAVNASTGAGTGVNKLTSTVLPTRAATMMLGGSVTPNPSIDGLFRVQWLPATHTGTIMLTVSDALGRQVQHRTLEASRATEITLDLSQQKAGLYQVKLESAAGVSQLRAQVL